MLTNPGLVDTAHASLAKLESKPANLTQERDNLNCHSSGYYYHSTYTACTAFHRLPKTAQLRSYSSSRSPVGHTSTDPQGTESNKRYQKPSYNDSRSNQRSKVCMH